MHRILREGQDEFTFNQSLDRLLAENPHRLRLMESVCQRLEFCEILKYGSQFPAQQDISPLLRLNYQIDRIITYLTLTTLDIIAREALAGHDLVDFPRWFASGLGRESPPPAIAALSETLSKTNPSSSSEVLRERMPSLRDAYHAEEGVTRLFKRLLCEQVDPWLQQWLCSVFLIARDVPFRDTVAPSSLPWRGLPPTERFALITDYLFWLRNQYTHTSDHVDAQELSPFRGPEADSASFSIRYSDVTDLITDKVRWFVALRSDLAESEVVRMVAVHLMRKWLGYRDGPSFTTAYLSRMTFRYHAYSLDHELLHNANAIGSWALIQSRVTVLGRFDLGPLLLPTAAAEELASADPPQRYRPLVQEQLARYLDIANLLNNGVTEAFRNAERLNDMYRGDAVIRSALKDAATSQQAADLLEAIARLRQSIDQTLSVPFY